MFVAYFLNLNHLVRESPAVRGVEYTSDMEGAMRFATADDALAYVAERGETRRIQTLAVA